MAQVFSQPASQIIGLVLWGLLALILVVPIGWTAFDHSPWNTGQFAMPAQPVPFSHAHHVGEVGLSCQYCHQGVMTSASAGLPSTEVCMTCHSQILKDAPILEPIRASFRTGKPVVWQRVNKLPDYVYFNHAAHVNNGVGCVTCHGRVDDMPLMQQAAPLTMQWCLNCHRDPAPNLRPAQAEFSMDWQPADDPRKLGVALLAHYHIHPETLTDCYVCHR
ncbi:MAG: cytochrome c3 family protein [Devosia sp.]